MHSLDSSNNNTRLNGTAVAALLGCGLFLAIGLFSPGLVLPQLERAFATTPHVELLTQLVGSIASFSFAIAAPFAGMLVARFGCRRIIVPALLLFAVIGTAPVLLDDLRSIVAMRVLLGFAFAGVFTGAMTGIGMLPEQQRARSLGLFTVVSALASIGMFPVIGAVARTNWRLAFFAHLIALLIVPLAMRIPRMLGIAESGTSSTSRSGSKLLTPGMIGLLALAGFAGLATLLPPMYSPLYLSSIGINDTRMLAVPVTLGSIAGTLASAAYGYVHGRVGINGLWWIAMTLMGLSLIGAGFTSSFSIFSSAIVVESAMLALIAPNVSAAALAISPREQGSQAIGLANGVMFGSQLLFPFIANSIRSATSAAGVFIVFGGIALAIGVMTYSYFGVVRRLARS